MDRTTALIEAAHHGDKNAREQLIEENLGLVFSILKRFVNSNVDRDDLFQIGTIGLMKAIDHFDTKFNVKLSTYAVPLITGEIKRFIRDDGPVRVSRSLKENAYRIKRASEELSQKNGKEPTLAELSEKTGIPMEDIVLSMEASVEVESIYKSVYQSDGNEIYLIDQVVRENHSGVGRISADLWEDTEKDGILNKILLGQLINELNDRERRIIEMRYFEEKTQTEVAALLGISQVQVSRMEKKILTSMRKKIRM